MSQKYSGTITDADNQGIPGVLVQNFTQGTYAQTDFFGKYSLSKVELNDSLKFSLIGYASKTILYQSKDDLTLQLDEKSISLEGVEVKRGMDAQTIFADVNLVTNPVNSSQDLLRLVPGLFTGQHAGGGKAEQIFLRGFDIDHGTDLNISVDGLPVNMVSHAHGQGYSDLHFVIPETVDGIEFSKGSYKADQGNFATAGSVSFKTKDKLEESSVKVEAGSFNQKRALGMINLTPNSEGTNAYLASEYLYNDGPFESPQNFNRFNLMGKWNKNLSSSEKIAFSGSYFTSRWDASGQIPVRAVESGLISRFGAIDDTEGGNTSRTNASFQYAKSFRDNSLLQTRAYYTNYDFLLFSNFTFFAINPENGDQIKQAENRNLLGVETTFSKQIDLSNSSVELSANAGLRSDFIRDNELSRTKNKTEILENVYYGNINETNSFLNLNAAFEKGKVQVIPGLRFDHFYFQYNDLLINAVSDPNQQRVLVSPKLNFIVQPSSKSQFFLKTGTGYHSNDSRAVIARRNNQILPRSYGADLGTVLKPSSKLLVNATLWYLHLDQEFVYVGDEGIVEASGRTRRLGADLGLRLQMGDKVFIDSDITYSHARSIDDPVGENYIPLAPMLTYSGGISFTDFKGFSGSLKTRVLGDRPANEDYSIKAEGYWITDANLSYQAGAWRLGLIIQNLLNKTWNETQFATESRLYNELNSVEEIHFTPGAPFQIRTSLSFNF